VLAELAADRRTWSASSLETWASCPVRWFVERLLRPAGIDPDSEPLAAGSVAHAVLRDVLEGLRRAHGSARMEASTLEDARGLMRASLARRCEQTPLSVVPEAAAAARRRLEADLGRYLEETAAEERSFEPFALELPFGLAESGGADAGERGGGSGPQEWTGTEGRPEGEVLPALEIGAGVRVGGRIDRVDVGPHGEAIVYDYKRRSRAGMAAARWAAEGNLQLPLYMRAVGRLLGREVVGGFYQPVGGEHLRPRGLVREDVELTCTRTDRRGAEEFEEVIEEALAAARAAALEAGAGALEARPQSCSFGAAGCVHPTICRCER
jgi:RecB family exonuclease